jgi:hypothetical protein
LVTAEIMARLVRLASPVTVTVLGALVLAEIVALLALEGLDHQLTWSLALIEPSGLLIFFSFLIVLSVAAGLYAVLCYRLGHPGLPLAAAAQVWCRGFSPRGSLPCRSASAWES